MIRETHANHPREVPASGSAAAASAPRRGRPAPSVPVPDGPRPADTGDTGRDAEAITGLLPGPAGAAPFYLVHPVGGSLLCYLPLARALAARHPVRGIASPLLSGRPAPDELSELAERYAGWIAADTRGPCLVGGWSFGGAAAFETAGRLAARGRTVDLLVLLDATPPGSWTGPLDDDTLARQFLYEVRRMSGVSDAEARAGHAADPLGAAVREMAAVDPDADEEETYRRFAAFRRHARSLTGHRPVRPHPGPALVVDTEPVGGAGGRGDAWLPHLAGPVHRLRLPTDHFGLMGAAPASAVAAAVDRARTGA
ncbi:thioesterase domain-containing protein [Streptomyces coeruleorubidus]|uniref:thioesterase domain-containing protein n=1 Tax=Streptomyces coeruleorubidus TaxID=116188 RepID=UPI0036CFBE69